MRQEQHQVREFMKRAEQHCPDMPIMPEMSVRRLRVKLIAEELAELCDAFGVSLLWLAWFVFKRWFAGKRGKLSLVEAYDATLDLLVVTIGTGVSMGTDLEPGWHEVHRSNMSKFIDGYKRRDGKWVKGPSYSPAKLEPVLRTQL